MTAYEVITLADELAPNVFSNAVKLFELNRLERRIWVDILGQEPEDLTPISAANLEDASGESGVLTLEERYRDVYVFWMISMYYYHMGEYEEFANKKAAFDEAWKRFERDVCEAWHQGTGRPEYLPVDYAAEGAY